MSSRDCLLDGSMPRSTSHVARFWLSFELSRRQSREDIQNGAISINGEKVTDLEFEWTKEQSFEERFVIVRRGKKKYFLVVLK